VQMLLLVHDILTAILCVVALCIIPMFMFPTCWHFLGMPRFLQQFAGCAYPCVHQRHHC
jgi:hypothetical protein